MATDTRDDLIAAWLDLLQEVGNTIANFATNESERKHGHTGHAVSYGAGAEANANGYIAADTDLADAIEDVVDAIDARFQVHVPG